MTAGASEIRVRVIRAGRVERFQPAHLLGNRLGQRHEGKLGRGDAPDLDGFGSRAAKQPGLDLGAADVDATAQHGFTAHQSPRIIV